MFAGYLNQWLLYRFHPKVRVQHTWEYVAGLRHWAEAVGAWNDGPQGLQIAFDRYQVHTIVLNTGQWRRLPGLVGLGARARR